MSTRAVHEPMAINPRKIAAALAQLGSFGTTYGCVMAMGGKGYQGFLIAAVLEVVLAAAKSLVFDGRKSSSDAFGWIAILVDTFLNAGGIWPMVKVLDNAPTWIMLKESMNLQGDIGSLPALIVALALGYLLSVAPHRLWRGGS